MASQIEVPGESRLNWLKVLLMLTLVAGGIAADYYFGQQPWPLRALGWLSLLAVVAIIFSRTTWGKRLISFARDARIEMRKVVWPTRQETIQTTFIIAIAVVILALALWCIDGLLVWLVGWLTGQRG